MRSNKVLDTTQIKWPKDNQVRLSYQMLFKEESDLKLDEDIDLATHLKKRDEKWRNKLRMEKEKAFKEGFEQGRTEGFQKAQEDMDSKLRPIRDSIEAGHEEWKNRQRIVDPGLLDLAFEISEAILGIPIENEAIRDSLKEQLVPILKKLDDQAKPFINVNEKDLELAKELKEEYAGKLTVHISGSEKCNPGEFELETNEEIIVYKFQEILKEFKANLMLPTWK